MTTTATPNIDSIINEVDERGFCVVHDVICPEKADEAREVLHGLLDEDSRARWECLGWVLASPGPGPQILPY